MNFRKINVLFLLLTSAMLSQADAALVMTARHSHTTTLLAEGNILIAGGLDNTGTPTNLVEMYNMATNQYETWGFGLAVARSSHTATLMSDGRVLIAGGFSAGVPLNSTEICNPVTKSCANTGLTMAVPRGGHTAILISSGSKSGQVLLCGGQSGAMGITITATCDIFNPVGPAIAPAASMYYPRMGHAAVLLSSGKVFITGGKLWDPLILPAPDWLYEPNTEIYDPAADTWAKGAALLQGRTDHTVTVLNNGVIMIAGGYNFANVKTCKLNSPVLTTDECWHIKYALDPLVSVQNTGNHGYLDGAEYFNQKGGRTVLGETTFGRMPYRVSKSAAVLHPDGSWQMFGGYGGIVPSFFTDGPKLSTNTVIYTVNPGIGSTTAFITAGTSIIELPLKYALSRAVSGRLVDADTYLSLPTNMSDPTAATDNLSLYMARTRAPLDGKPVGEFIDTEHAAGEFDSMVTLQSPNGTAKFSRLSLSSDGSISNATVITSTFTIPTLFPGDNGAFSGDMTTWIVFTLPDIYRGIHGLATITNGGMQDATPTLNLSFKKGGTATLNIPQPNYCDSDLAVCVYITTAAFTGASGTIANMTSLDNGTTYYAPNLETAGFSVTLTMDFDFTADQIIFKNRDSVAYNFDTSTTVIREMVYSSTLVFYPKTANWKDLSTQKDPSGAATYIQTTLPDPVFDEATLLTPAADAVVIGGQNCEAAPAADCIRATKNFRSRASVTPYIDYFSPNDTLPWPLGPKLNTKRAFHTSTLLVSGQVLTCGGTDGARNLATCELLDAERTSWKTTGSMNFPRAMHTATLLPNGNVLATGGVTLDGTSLKSAEIYYPATQRWVAVQPMAQARQRHTATLLQDGNVLVAGGDNTASAEIFISSNATWVNVGSMTRPRGQHTATLLKNGNVLMAGGVGSGALYQTEVYNFAARTFTDFGFNLNTPRFAHTANLLKDGRVMVAGGSDNIQSGRYAEIYDGSGWGLVSKMKLNRTNHRSVLLPNGKVLLTGGETAGGEQTSAESYDPDYIAWSYQGMMTGRSGHTSVLMQDNFVLNIGGWDGTTNLDTTEAGYFPGSPDGYGLEAETTRQMIISTATSYFDHGMWATLFSSAANFHGITEASGGGAGSRNSSHSNPRVYMNQMDNPSGFMIDLSTRIYSLYGGQNTNWQTTLSSITIITPTLPGEMPYGWYTMRVANGGLFSRGVPVQVTIPRPVGAPTAPTGLVLGISSITWSWTRGTIPPGGADGYNIYASSNDVFVSTTAFTDSASYTQTGMRPNTQASLMVNSYNIGGTGPLARSTTYYTLAAPPTGLNITGASFETANLAWGNNSNTAGTLFELSMYTCAPGDSLANCGLTAFSEPLAISTPIPFNVNFASTQTSINQLTPNLGYFFRVRAENGAGLTTAFSNIVSTLTVGNVSNLTGTAISSSAISWSWDESTGADAYEVYDISAGTTAPVFIGSTTVNYLTQEGLQPNNIYVVTVNAMKTTPVIKGPPAYSPPVYTLAVQPGVNPLNAFTSVSTGSVTVNWMSNGNSTWTVYQVQVSTSPDYPAENFTLSVTTPGISVTFSGLLPNIKIYARVAALNGDNVFTAATALGTKYTRARAPSSVTPSVISMSGVTLTWDQSGNAPGTVYEVRYTTETFAISSTTYIPFSAGFTGSSFAFPGLLTGTTYYFDVAASNGEGFVTARIQAVPAALTLAGPSGAPTGSIGGTSNPKKDVTISGVLPTGRSIGLTVPAGSFPASTAIAISSSAQNPCSYLVGGIPIEVAVYSQAAEQPQVPVTLTLSYSQTEAMAAIDNKRQNMVLARYNPVSGQCLPLETTIDTGRRTITATLNHFSTFQLMLKTAATNLSNVLIYPNPFYANRGQGFVTITNMPASASVRIYTLSGDKVWEGSASTTGMLIWRAQNRSGELVASGVYLAVIDSSAGKKVFKLAVER